MSETDKRGRNGRTYGGSALMYLLLFKCPSELSVEFEAVRVVGARSSGAFPPWSAPFTSSSRLCYAEYRQSTQKHHSSPREPPLFFRVFCPLSTSALPTLVFHLPSLVRLPSRSRATSTAAQTPALHPPPPFPPSPIEASLLPFLRPSLGNSPLRLPPRPLHSSHPHSPQPLPSRRLDPPGSRPPLVASETLPHNRRSARGESRWVWSARRTGAWGVPRNRVEYRAERRGDSRADEEAQRRAG